MTTILIVDDNPDDRTLYRRYLSRRPDSRSWNVHEAGLGTEGMAIYRDEPVDCVLLDHNLPDMTGLDFIREASDSTDKEVPILVLTGQGSEPIAVQSMKLGAVDYLVKGEVTADNLNSAITSAMARFELESRLREKEREMESFAFAAAHDLKSPVQKIGSFSQILSAKLEGADEDVLDIAQRIESNAARLSELIDRLLEFARMGRNDAAFTEVDLNNVLSIVADNLSVLREKNDGEINVGQLPVVRGDKTVLIQLFQNLVGNGLKFHREGVKPRIEVTSRKMEGGRHEIRVEDNGIGMEDADLGRIFEPLTRLHARSRFDGTGLGLTTARKAAEQHGGRIRVESQLDEGTAFYVELPDQGVLTPGRTLLPATGDHVE